MKIRIFLLYIILVAGLECCNNRQDISSGKEFKIVDSMQKDIPLTKSGKPKFLYRKFAKETSLLGIENLEEGFDSIQLRIWMPESIKNKREVVIISNTKKKGWEAKIGRFYSIGNLDSNNMKIIDMEWKIVKPKSGWKFFLDSIFKLHITSLPDITHIKGYEVGADGDVFTFEIGIQNKYRFYQYWEPFLYQKKFWQALESVEIIQLLKEQLRD